MRTRGSALPSTIAHLSWIDRDRLDPSTRAGLLGPGAPFEMARRTVHGVEVETFVNAPGSIAEMVVNGTAHGGNAFLVDRRDTVGFASLPDVVARRAGALRVQGVVAGDRVLTAGVPSIDHALTVLAISWLGAVVTAVNPRSTAAELVRDVELTGPRIAIIDPDVGRSSPPDLEALTFGELAAVAAPPVDEPVVVGADDPAVILFTSGTTGRPKGAVLTHRNVVHFCFASAATILVKRLVDPPERPSTAGRRPVGIACSPMFHVSGLFGQLINSLAWGSTVVYLSPGRWDPAEQLELTARHGVTMWSLVPTQLQRLLDHPDFDRHDLSSLESVGGGGATFSPELLRRTAERLPTVRTGVRVGYGMTESAGLLTVLAPPYPAAEAASVGWAAAGCEIEIRAADGEVVPEGVVGEIWARSAAMFEGYWADPEATAEAFDAGRWYRTGDYGRVDDGALYLESRLRDMIIRAGENIYPIEIENRLAEHPSVADAAVIGVEHADLGQDVKAVVELRDGASATAEELRSWCAISLARHKVPSVVEFATLPRNAVGKVLKRRLT